MREGGCVARWRSETLSAAAVCSTDTDVTDIVTRHEATCRLGRKSSRSAQTSNPHSKHPPIKLQSTPGQYIETSPAEPSYN